MSATSTPKKNKNGFPDNPEQFYPTPVEFVRYAMEFFFKTYSYISPIARPHCEYLDAGAGLGVWGKVTREILTKEYSGLGYIAGCELRTVAPPPEFDEWRQLDFIHEPNWYDRCANVIVTNPPFWCINEWTLACEKALARGGVLWMLAPLNYQCGEARHQLLFPNWKPVDIYPIPQRMSFDGSGHTDAREYAMMMFRQGYNPDFSRVYYGKMSWYPSKVKLTLKGKQKKVKVAKVAEQMPPMLIGVDNE